MNEPPSQMDLNLDLRSAIVSDCGAHLGTVTKKLAKQQISECSMAKNPPRIKGIMNLRCFGWCSALLVLELPSRPLCTDSQGHQMLPDTPELGLQTAAVCYESQCLSVAMCFPLLQKQNGLILGNRGVSYGSAIIHSLSSVINCLGERREACLVCIVFECHF